MHHCKLGSVAAESKNGGDSTGSKMCSEWFLKFKKGKLDLEDRL